MSQSESQWKTHPRLENIECSRDGAVRNRVTGTIYKQHTDRDGYKHICVTFDRRRKWHGHSHRLIAETFVGPVAGKTVNHKNGRKDDNRAENLEVVTHAVNCAHAWNVLHPTKPIGGKLRKAVA